MEKYSIEMDKLAEGLELKNIPFTYKNLYDGFQIKTDNWDAVCHGFSYGSDEGLLEIMGDIVSEECEDEVEGYLTAEEILNRL